MTSALDVLDRKKLTVYMGEKTERLVGVVAGSSGESHLLLLAGEYCTCPSFQFSAQLYCKHLLAVKLAQALDSVETIVVEDSHVENLLMDLA